MGNCNLYGCYEGTAERSAGYWRGQCSEIIPGKISWTAFERATMERLAEKGEFDVFPAQRILAAHR